MLRKLMGVASRAVYQQAPPLRDEAYRRWIRSFSCVVCGTRRRIEAAHTGPQERHGIDIPDVVAMFNALWNERKKAA